MILYYSQTHLRIPSVGELFQYLIKLHYSQTLVTSKGTMDKVSVPYEITLLSNYAVLNCTKLNVSVPYEITLLSNLTMKMFIISLVSVPYEITLLSNKSARQAQHAQVSVPYEITLLSNEVVPP